MFNKMKIKQKLLGAFLLVGVIPALIIAYTSILGANRALEKAEYSKLETLRKNKKVQIVDFFDNQQKELEILRTVVQTYENQGFVDLNVITEGKRDSVLNYIGNIEKDVKKLGFNSIFDMVYDKSEEIIKKTKSFNNLSENSIYLNALNNLDNKIDDLVKDSEFEEIYLINAKTGYINYASGEGKGIGNKLLSKTNANLIMSNIRRNVLKTKEFYIHDFIEYNYQNNEQSLFAAKPVLDANGEVQYIIVARYNKTGLNKILNNFDGLGETGETYLAGKEDVRMEFRSDLKTMGDGEYIVGYDLTKNAPDYWSDAFNGQNVSQVYTDSAGKLVMVQGYQIKEKGLDWIIISKKNLEEVVTKKIENKDIYSMFMEKFNFYDLYLIHPEGDVFYSVAKESDYHTNILTGEYSKDGLGKLVKKIKKSKSYHVEDFSPYSPSQNEVSLFIGLPIMKGEEIRFILAAQVTSDKINSIMAHIEEMGDTGESLLIGGDLRMRSDSYLDPINRTVKASFDNKASKTGRVDTQDALAALRGKSQTIEMQDYMGNDVITSYTGVDISGVKWALITKMNKEEVRQSIVSLSTQVLIILLIALVAIVAFALILAGSISKPILLLNEWAKEVANGNNELVEIKTSKDELGMLTSSFSEVVSSIRKITKICSEIAVGDLSDNFKERSKNDLLGKSINKMRESFLDVVGQSKRIVEGDYSSDLIPRSEKDELSFALNKMVMSLRESSEYNEKQNWTKTGQAELSKIMQGDQRIEELTKKIITKLCKYLGGDVGTIFIKSVDDRLKLISSYAFTERKKHISEVKAGEGLIGQALLEKEMIVLNQVPDDYMFISSATGESKASSLVIVPCLYKDEVKGVLEIGKIGSFSDMEKEFLAVVSTSIAIGIHSTEAQTEMSLLLDKTLKQSEELQQQQEELRQTNEELEEQANALKRSEENLKQQQEELRQTNEELEQQTKDLKASEEQLQAQQEELRVTNEELEERTLNLEKQKKEINEKNEILKTAQIEIEKKALDLEVASKYKSEFLANMSHELRTPLNSILILSQLLSRNKDENLNDSEVDFAQTINSSGTDLLNLINDILDLSKVEAGKMEINIEEFSVESFMKDIERTFIHVIREKGLDFKLEFDGDIPESIKCDEQRLSQVIKNLMSNAIKFTDEGEVELKAFNPKDLKLKVKGLKDKEVLAFSVRDTGIGIPEDKLAHIFEAFQQADGTTSRKFGGTGLGLSISREFVRLFGGEIQIRSTESEGSEFIVIIPVEVQKTSERDTSFNAVDYIENNFSSLNSEESVEGAELDLGKDHKKKSDRNLESSKLEKEEIKVQEKKSKKKKIELPEVEVSANENDYLLIIEDDSKFSAFLKTMAGEKSFESIVADSGEKGLAIAKKVKPMAIILDVGLPGISGWEVLEFIKKDSHLKNVPVHIMSAGDEKDEYKKLGIIDYIQKPVSIETLNKALDDISALMKCELKRMLIAENDKIHTSSMKAYLRSQGQFVDIVSVPTAEETLQLLKEDNFDCMILDLGLDDMSGIDLLAKIRRDDISQIPIIIYTGKDLTQEENEKLQKYAEAVIIKGPDSIDRLVDETNLFMHHIEEQVREKKHRVVKSEYEKEASLVGKKVLVVDDDMRNVFALSNLLESKGIEVETAKNGRVAVEIAKENSFDCILMDIMMPEMDGYTATRAIRKLSKYRDIPIIALTAKAMKEDRNKCISAGASDYMAKPIDGDKLLNLLRVWLY